MRVVKSTNTVEENKGMSVVVSEHVENIAQQQSSNATGALTDSRVVRVRKSFEFHKITFSSVIRKSVSHKRILNQRWVNWGTNNGNVVAQVLKNLDSVVIVTVKALAMDGRWMNEGVHSGVVCTSSRVSVTENGVLQKSGSVVESMTWDREVRVCKC